MTSDFKRAASRVKKLEHRMGAEIEDGLEDGVEDMVSEMKRHLARQGSVASGTLIRGIHQVTEPDVVPGAAAGQLIFGPNYWRYLEFGTGMGSKYKAASPQAPVEPIHRWIVAKGILPDPTGPYDTQLELARRIAETAGTSTEAHPFIRPTWRGPRGKERIVKRVGDGMERAVDRSFRGF